MYDTHRHDISDALLEYRCPLGSEFLDHDNITKLAKIDVTCDYATDKWSPATVTDRPCTRQFTLLE